MKNVGKVWLIMLLMLVSASFYALKTPNVEAAGTIYIRADGSIDPPTANITRDEFNMTYTFTGNNYDTIVIERSNIILNGAGFTLKVASADGISFQYQSNITIENLNVDAGPNSFGIYAYYSNNITIFGCRVYSSSTGISIYYTSYCKIYGNTIEGNGIGISITGSEVESAGHHNLIYNNTVASNSNHGIYLLGYSNSVYRNNVTGNNRGISIGGNFNNVYENIITRNKYPDGEGISIHSQGGGCNVSYNYVAENTWGIMLGAGHGDYTPNTLKGNVMVNNSRINFGLEGYRAEMPHLYNDVDTSNTVNGKPIYCWISKENDALPLDAGFVALINCKNITVANLNIEKNLEGIILAYSNNCTIYGNNLTDNGYSSYYYGNIALYRSSNNSIYNNNVATSNWNGHGIVLDHGSSHNTVSKNNITKTSVGVYLPSDSHHNNISSNFLKNNGNRGISLEYSSNNKVHNNDILGPGKYGIYLGMEHNIISENNITAYQQGVYVVGQRNTIVGNNIMDNLEKGISLDGSFNNFTENNIMNNNEGVYLYSYGTNNLFFHNNFVDNKKHVTYYWSGIANSWNNTYPIGGNYWTGYEDKYPNATELNNSGLWDTPYIINTKNIDYYPLMAPTKPITRKFTAYDDTKVEVRSNSSISQFQFDTTAKSISFNITGPAGTKGFCNITVPLNLLWGDFTLYMDGVQLEEGVNYMKTCNDVQCLFHITYTHSAHELEILGTEVIPERLSLAAVLLFTIFTVLATIKTRNGFNRTKGFLLQLQG